MGNSGAIFLFKMILPHPVLAVGSLLAANGGILSRENIGIGFTPLSGPEIQAVEEESLSFFSVIC
jgi:hypothetical protein